MSDDNASPPPRGITRRTTPCQDSILVLVRLDLGRFTMMTEDGRLWDEQINARLRWFSETLFPRDVYWNRELVILTDGRLSPGISPDLFRTLTEWDVFCDWEDLYVKLITAGFHRGVFNGFDASRQFSFALFLNLRRDEEVSGDGYAREESPQERLILRACALTSRGNVLFGDWGLPAEQPAARRTPLEDLIDFWDLDNYLYASAHPPRKAAWRGQAKFARNGNYLRAISRSNDVLPPDYLERIAKAVERKLFDEDALENAVRIARWDLFFASDLYLTRYYSHRLCVPWRVQYRILGTYARMRAWWVSSTRRQLAWDFLSFFAGSTTFAVLFRTRTTKGTPPSSLDFLVTAPMIFAAVFFSIDLVFGEIEAPESRPSRWWERPRRFLMLALELWVVTLFLADDGIAAWYAWLITGILFRLLPRDFTQNPNETEKDYVFYDTMWLRWLPVAFVMWFVARGLWIDASITRVDVVPAIGAWVVAAYASRAASRFVGPRFIYHHRWNVQ